MLKMFFKEKYDNKRKSCKGKDIKIVHDATRSKASIYIALRYSVKTHPV